MYVYNERIQDSMSLCIPFADDILLVGESREELNGTLELWKQALEVHIIRISRSETNIWNVSLATNAQILT